MTSSMPVSEEMLQNAFALAEEKLRSDDWNTAIAKTITDDAPGRNIQWERSADELIESAFIEFFPECSVYRNKQRFKQIDVCMICDGRVAVAIECKGMVSNSHTKDSFGDSLNVHGIWTKLHRDKRSSNSIEEDIEKLPAKLATLKAGPHFQIFVPIIYELYRKGGRNEWLRESKPYVTLPKYKRLRKTLERDLRNWFQANYPDEFTLFHGTRPIELRNAGQLWQEQGQTHYPAFKSLKAYVSFFAFGRFVE